MHTPTFGEAFEFEHRFAFGENGPDSGTTPERYRAARQAEVDEIGAAFSELLGPDFECDVFAVVAPDLGFIGGFFDDDGNRLDPENIRIPSLCIACKRHCSDDWEEEAMCTLMRLNQRDCEDFCCDGFTAS
jgi:hypothetical protein